MWITGDSSGVVNIPGSLTVAGSAVGGASVIGDLTDVSMDITNFTDGFLLQTDSDGSAPTTGTLNGATGNIGIGKDVLSTITSADYNVAIGYDAGKVITTGGRNVMIGEYAGEAQQTGTDCVIIGARAGRAIHDRSSVVMIGRSAGENAQSTGVIFIGNNAGQHATSDGQGFNVAIGYDAGKYGANCSYAMYMGYAAGEGHSTNTSNAVNNTGIGHMSLQAITTGDYNLGLGYKTLNDNTTGSRNLAIGNSALDLATTESDNIAIGYDALGGAVAGGEKNIAIGNYTLDALTSSDQTVAIGHEAGSAITTGSWNTAVGDGSMKSVTTNYKNTSLGFQSMYAHTGNSSVAIGAEALKGTGGYGSQNTAVGATAGYAMTTGMNNLMLGFSAGNNITSGNNNIVIGAADVTATSSDQLSISSGDGSPVWITGNSDGGVAIGGIEQRGATIAAASTANDAYITLLEVPYADYKAIKASVHITDSTNSEVQTMDVMAHYDGSAANYTSYGIIFDGAAAIGSIEADVNGSNLRLRFKNEQGGTATLAGSIHAVLHA